MSDRNYTRYDGKEPREGICYQKTSERIAKKFQLSKLEKINEMYFGRN